MRRGVCLKTLHIELHGLNMHNQIPKMVAAAKVVHHHSPAIKKLIYLVSMSIVTVDENIY